jgi:hypothetical protein
VDPTGANSVPFFIGSFFAPAQRRKAIFIPYSNCLSSDKIFSLADGYITPIRNVFF